MIAIYGIALWQMAHSFSLSCFNIPLNFTKMVIDLPNNVAYFQAADKPFIHELFVKAAAATTLTGLWVGVVKIFLCVIQKY